MKLTVSKPFNYFNDVTDNLEVHIRKGPSDSIRSWKGDYRGYIRNLVQEIESDVHGSGPFTLYDIHMLQSRYAPDEDRIDPFGLLTHRDDRMDSGLPGIWPLAGLRYWLEANTFMASYCSAMNVDLKHITLEVETHFRAADPPFSFGDQFDQMMEDPRWEVEIPELWNISARTLQQESRASSRWVAFVIGYLIIPIIKRQAMSPWLSYYPNLIVTDYEDRLRNINWIIVNEDTSRIIHTLREMVDEKIESLPMAGTASNPAYYWNSRYGNSTDGQKNDLNIEIAKHGASNVVPWIAPYSWIQNRRGNSITLNEYVDFLRFMKDAGITKILGWNFNNAVEQDERAVVSVLHS